MLSFGMFYFLLLPVPCPFVWFCTRVEARRSISILGRGGAVAEHFSIRAIWRVGASERAHSTLNYAIPAFSSKYALFG